MEKETEQKVLEAARKVFVRRGFDGARMQEIADEAGVNKSMVHYYFRNKKELFHRIFRDATSRILPQLRKILNSELPLEQKVPKFVETYIDLLRENPNLPGFIIQELNRNPEGMQDFFDRVKDIKPEVLNEQVQDRREKGEIIDIDPDQFLVSLVSLCVFPFAARNMIQKVLDYDSAQFEDFLEQRKQVLPEFILKGVGLR